MYTALLEKGKRKKKRTQHTSVCSVHTERRSDGSESAKQRLHLAYGCCCNSTHICQSCTRLLHRNEYAPQSALCEALSEPEPLRAHTHARTHSREQFRPLQPSIHTSKANCRLTPPPLLLSFPARTRINFSPELIGYALLQPIHIIRPSAM